MRKIVISRSLPATLAAAAGLLLALAPSCRRAPFYDGAAGAVSIDQRQPVGPVPGLGEPPPVANPLEGDANALQEGRRLFVQFNCAGCHGGRAGGGMGPSLRDVDWLYGGSPGAIHDSIAAGRSKGMPAWGTRIPDRQIWELALYVSSLRTPSEPDRPR
jgi:cytochrome c oxidase cbb3-type subunit III